MLAEKNTAIKNAVSTLYHISQDDMIRQRCERRREYYIHEQKQKEYREQLENDLLEEISRADSAEAQLAAERQKVKELSAQIEAMKKNSTP